MKKLILFSLLVLTVFSCSKKDDFPTVKETTKGEKWGIKIKSTPEEVYHQLQQLGKGSEFFFRVILVFRQPFSDPEEVKELLTYYDALTLQSTSGRVDRAVLKIGENKITGIEVGGALLEEVSSWPKNVSPEKAVNVGDGLGEACDKLQSLYEKKEFSDWELILPDKPLSLDFDPDMKNYVEWTFDFFEEKGKGIQGRHQVRLYFKENKLIKIRDTYDQYQTYN